MGSVSWASRSKQKLQPIPKSSDCDTLPVCREREKLTLPYQVTILPDREEVKMNVGIPREDATESKLYL